MTDIQKENKSGGKVPNRGSVNFPRLRFPEFEGEYRQYSFEDLFLFSTGKNIKQNEASREYETPCVRYGELYHLYNEIISEVINKTNLDKSDLTFSIGNEILLPSAGEDPLDIGSASALTIKGVAIGRTINILRPLKKNLYSNIYVSYYINEKLKKKISTLAKGVSISNVYNSDLKILNALLPSISEQQKISSFLLLINSRIQTQNKIINDLKTLKIATAKKIFSGELRFKDDNGNDFPEWEVREVGEVFKITRGNVLAMNLVSNQCNEKNTYPVYSSQTKNNGLAGYYTDFLFEDAITWTTDGANAGDVNYRSGKFYCTNVCGVLISNEGYANSCIAELINSVSKNYVSYVGNPKLMNGVMSEIKIPFPSLPEQTKIANFLSAIDSKIDIESQLLQKLEEQKKFLLQNMFV